MNNAAIQWLGPALAAFLLFAASVVSAQTVTGRVLETGGTASQHPAAHVTVTLASGQGRTSPAFTDQEGRYYFHDIEPGSYTLEVWVLGFKTGIPVTRQVDVPRRQEVILDPVVVPLVP